MLVQENENHTRHYNVSCDFHFLALTADIYTAKLSSSRSVFSNKSIIQIEYLYKFKQ